MAKIIMHIDLNAFFATAEEIRDPSLAGKPLVVGGSGRRGIVSTASYAARKYGVHSAMPTYMAKRLCPNLVVISPDFHLYSRLSHEFFSFLRTYSQIQEVASIDECYMDMTNAMKDVSDPHKFLLDLQTKLYQQTKLKCSIGLAPTKFLAKMASDIKKPMGITILRRRDIKKILWPLPISSMFGIGKKTWPKLEKIGIKTIGDFAESTDPLVKQILGKFYYVLLDWAHGQGNDLVESEPDDPKSIGHSSTFLNDTNDSEEIVTLLNQLAKEVSEEAKRKDYIGSTIQIVIKNSDFSVINRSETLLEATNDYSTIAKIAVDLLNHNYQGQLIRLIGVTLQNIVRKEDAVVQMSLFDFSQVEKENETRALISEINRKMKKDLLLTARDLKKKQER